MREKDAVPTSKTPPIPCIFYPWFKDHAKLMIYFHGIGEDLHVIQREIQFIRDMLMINVLAVEYPGYGVNWNDGICSEERMRSDARQVLKFILEETDLEMKHIILLGRSMGSAVAAAGAAEFQRYSAALIVCLSPFYSLKELARQHAGACGAHLLANKFNSGENFTKVNQATPVLLVHGTVDTLVPV